jgi:hypothetical protein
MIAITVWIIVLVAPGHVPEYTTQTYNVQAQCERDARKATDADMRVPLLPGAPHITSVCIPRIWMVKP